MLLTDFTVGTANARKANQKLLLQAMDFFDVVIPFSPSPYACYCMCQEQT